MYVFACAEDSRTRLTDFVNFVTKYKVQNLEWNLYEQM